MGNTEFGQLLKLPRIFDHYQLHTSINPLCSFSQFIISHYIGDDGTGGDDAQDKALPFMSQSALVLLLAPIPDIYHPLLKAHRFGMQDHPMLAKGYLPNGYLEALFRPPSHA